MPYICMNINDLRTHSNFDTMSGMKARYQYGYINALLLPLIGAVVLLMVATIFAFWAFSGRQDYKNNSDKKVAAAVEVAKRDTQKADAAQYAEQAKSPYKTYVGPEAYGSINVVYPKTWSAYVVEHTGNTGTPMNNYFQPNAVPDVTDPNNAYALRVQVVSQTYSQVLNQFNGLAQTKKVVVSPYNLPKVPSVIGARVDGQIAANKQGSMIVLPLRNVTLEISTESEAFLSDFNNIILPNISFSP